MTKRLGILVDSELVKMRLRLETNSGYLPIVFEVEAPLSDEQRETLRCYGVVWEDHNGRFMYGAVSRKGLAAFVALPFVMRIDDNNQRDYLL